jgi:hypothetical protein
MFPWQQIHAITELSPIVARQRLGKNVPAAFKTSSGVVSYAVRVVPKESMILVLPRTSCRNEQFTFALKITEKEIRQR